MKHLPEPASVFKQVEAAQWIPRRYNQGADHLRAVFGRMGFNDQDIVALSGAHTLGRAFKDRSGTVENGYTTPTKYTGDESPGGMTGGKSWTKAYLTFDNSYFQMEGTSDSELAAFPTDTVLASDAGFSPWFNL